MEKVSQIEALRLLLWVELRNICVCVNTHIFIYVYLSVYESIKSHGLLYSNCNLMLECSFQFFAFLCLQLSSPIVRNLAAIIIYILVLWTWLLLNQEWIREMHELTLRKIFYNWLCFTALRRAKLFFLCNPGWLISSQTVYHSNFLFPNEWLLNM